MPLPRIEPQNLVDFVRERQRGPMDCEHRVLSASAAVLRTYLGDDWLKRRLPSHHYFRKPEMGLSTDAFRAQARISSLGDMLLNMQHVEGIEHYVARLRTGEIESIVTELQCASALQQSGIPFRFVLPTGKMGYDYDVEATIGGVNVACEIKCKVESTAPSARTLIGTLEDARKQVPGDTANIVFVRLPEQWMITKEGYEAVSKGVDRFIRTDLCFSRVVVHAEDWRTLGDGGAICLPRFLLYTNVNARVPLLDSGTDQWLNLQKGSWLSIEEVVCDNARRLLRDQVDAAFRL